MDNSQILPFIEWMHSLSGEWMSVLLFILSAAMMLGVLRAFGMVGLFAYSAVATVLANIQILKLGQFALSGDPVALGTATFATVFLASDLITEHFGKEKAQKSVWLSLCLQLAVTVIMVIILGFNPIKGDAGHDALMAIFLPAPRLVTASIIAFATSQLLEIFIFQRLSKASHKKQLWLRTSVSVIISSLVDNIVFSTLAWVVLSPAPVSGETLVYTYILGTYLLRVLLALLSMPIMYLSYYIIIPEEK